MNHSPRIQPLSMRGLMLDAARLPECLGYYRRFFDFCQAWEVNTVLLRLADDGGLALRLASHPELRTYPDALTAEQMRELVEYAQQRGVELIPEIESFGHSRYITEASAYAELADVSADADKSHQEFNGLCPVHPRTLPLLSDIYREVLEIFPGRFLHTGCDEVNWGGSRRSKEALQSRSRHEIWADYLNQLNALVRGLGREMMIWGDHALRKEPDILSQLSKDIILLDWDYWTTDAAVLAGHAQRALEAGFRVVGTPALNWCRWGPRAGKMQLDNIDAFARAYRECRDERSLGVIVSNWVPQRFLQDATWDGLAYACQRLTDDLGRSQDQLFAAFVQRHLGATWNERWQQAFHDLYRLPPIRPACAPAGSTDAKLPHPWRNEAMLREVLRQGRKEAPAFHELRDRLLACRPQVRRNHDDFEALLLSTDYMEHLFWRESAVVQLCADASDALDETAATALIRAIAQRDQAMVDALIADWDRGRPKDAWRVSTPEGFVELFRDHLLYGMAAAGAYATALSENPARFLQILRDAQPANAC